MALKKEIEIAAFGVMASHHVVSSYGADLRANQCVVNVECYASLEAYGSGKQPLQRESVTIAEKVPADVITLDWIEQKLCEAEAPPAAVEEITPGMSMPQLWVSPNRWLFTGAERV